MRNVMRKRRSEEFSARGPVLLMYAVLFVLMICTIKGKVNLHVDEVFSYALANHTGESIYMEVETGVTYTPAQIPWTEYMTVQQGEQFGYGKVWQNQSNDVHPPLYYAMLHTICSCFPETYSIWFAASINMGAMIATLYVFRKLMGLLTGDEAVRAVSSWMFVCCAGVLSQVSFLRMYPLAMLWVTLLAYLFASHLGQDEKEAVFIGKVVLVTIAGALTHYYCTFFAVLISVFYGVYLLVCRQLKQTVLFCAGQAAAGVISVAVFPAMIRHVFSSGRGRQTMENLMNRTADTLWMRLRIFYEMLDDQLFGGMLLFLVLCGLLLLFVCGYGKAAAEEVREKKQQLLRYLCLFLPAVTEFIFVAKSAAYLSDRYLSPLYAVILAVVLGVLAWLLRLVCREKGVVVFAVLAVLMTISSWQKEEWMYQFRDSEPLLQAAEACTEVPCIFVYDEGEAYKLNSSYYEVRNYRSVTFYTTDQLEELAKSPLLEEQELILVIAGQEEEILQQFLQRCPAWSVSERLGEYDYTGTYHLRKAD